jgi:hypothetical protein
MEKKEKELIFHEYHYLIITSKRYTRCNLNEFEKWRSRINDYANELALKMNLKTCINNNINCIVVVIQFLPIWIQLVK